MDEFWEQAGQTVAVQQPYQPPTEHQTQDYQQFTYQSNQNNYANTFDQQQTRFQTQQYSVSFQSKTIQQDETAKAVREQQERILQKLRQKGNEQYELKLKRKQQARKDLEDFFHKKQEETKERKQQNRNKEIQLIKDIKSNQTTNGWQKVGKNIGVKQGQYKGKKDVNRMRQAIVRKRDDQLTN